MSRKKRQDTAVRKYVAEAIDRAFPEGLVAMWRIDHDDNYLTDLVPEIKAGFLGLKGASVLYENDPRGGNEWEWDADPFEDPPTWSDDSYSYHLWFVGMTGKKFQFEVETERPDEDDVLRPVKGTATMGCTVGVSLVAPFAAVMVDSFEDFADGGHSIPRLEFPGDDDRLEFPVDDGEEPIDDEENYWDLLQEEHFRGLENLRKKIIAVLRKFAIEVLPEEELRKPVPWLGADDEVFVPDPRRGEVLTVGYALFFCGV